MIYTTETLRETLADYKKPNDKIHRMIPDKKLFPITRGLHTTDPNNSGKYLSCFIYGPSYLSFDYALAQYHLIEKMPSSYQSATCGKRKTKSNDTPYGNFTYRDVPEEAFPLSVREEKVGDNICRIASPEKALCDKLYTMPPVRDMPELESVIFDIIGIERRRFCSLNLDDILCLGEKYRSKNVNLLMEYVLKIILRQCGYEKSTDYRPEVAENNISRRKSVKYYTITPKNNCSKYLNILIIYCMIDENKSEVKKMRRFDYGFLKEKAWDNEIVGYLSQIHEQKGKQLLYLRQKPADVEKLIEIAKIQSTESSNEIEGIRTTDTRLRQLMSEKTTPRTRDEKEIAGYRDALNTVHENFEYIPLAPNYILQLHKIMFSHTDSAFGGSFKNVQNYISATTPDGRTYALFTPLAPYETPEAMRELCDAYNFAIGEGNVDPLLIIPCFIHDFLCIHPFIDGNGRMSRLLTTLLLYRCGYEIGKYISLEAKIARTKGSYYDALEASQAGWHEGKDDPTAFIKYLLGTIIAAYRDFEERMELVSSSPLETVRNAVKTRIGKFTKAEIAELVTSMSAASVERHLRALCANGEIEKRGGGRSTYYIRKTI